MIDICVYLMCFFILMTMYKLLCKYFIRKMLTKLEVGSSQTKFLTFHFINDFLYVHILYQWKKTKKKELHICRLLYVK